MTVRTNLRVLVFPPDDVALRHEVDRALAEVTANVPEPRQMAALTERLRTWYRSIQIRQREPLGGYDDDPTTVWYVYRDGRIRARNEPWNGSTPPSRQLGTHTAPPVEPMAIGRSDDDAAGMTAETEPEATEARR
ncbi:MAG TPA: hypothetical protein VIK65_09035 [Candidatus Limnocylindrales bacterium]